MRRPARLSAAVATIALAALLGACGGGGDKAAGPAPTGTTAQTPSSSPTTAGPTVLTAATFADKVGAAATSGNSYDFTMAMTAAGQAINAQGSGASVGGKPTLAMTMDMGTQGSVAVRAVDGKFYMSIPEATGDKFFVIDPSDPNDPLSGTVDQMTGQTDPGQSIVQLKGAIVDVKPAGDPEQLDGVAAQPYDVTVDTSKLASMQAQATSAHVSLPATVTYRYWVGPDDLPRKLSMALLGTQTDMTFSHWGAGAPITAPTADQITTSPF